jgi:hypothetical protein
MNSKILSIEERRRLKKRLKDGEEDQTVKNLFTRLRKSMPTLIMDMRLIIEVYWELRRRNRWAGRTRDHQRYASRLRFAESG